MIPETKEHDYGDQFEDKKVAPIVPATEQISQEASNVAAQKAFENATGAPHIPVKTGTTCVLMKNPPLHIKDAGDFEPLYPP